MKTELRDWLETLDKTRVSYAEVQRSADLSSGFYFLPAGAPDPQGPHTEDEVYYVISGRGQIRVGEEDMLVGAGSVVFVAANVEHRFHGITEDLTVLVVFGPAEYSRKFTRDV